ncbi:UNVERIFIED_CONTAM: hypothetical protein FKN15_055241 [Acipenser sinensis]
MNKVPPVQLALGPPSAAQKECEFQVGPFSLMHRKKVCNVVAGNARVKIKRTLVELKNGETYNGHLVSCDNWMNINLREVICTSRRVPSAARFFTLCRLTVQPPQNYSVGGQRSSEQLTGKPAGARSDYRGRWCAVSRGHRGRPNPPSPRMTLGQLSAAPWELPSTVSRGITWTRTGDVQAIERIRHSSECFYWMRHTGAP